MIGLNWDRVALLSLSTTYLLLDVASTPCALEQSGVREILPLPRLHAPPAAGGPLIGFLNLAGTPVPVLDLAALLGLRDASVRDVYSHVVLLADGEVGLLVDRVADIVALDPETVRPVEDARSLNGCVAAEIVRGDRLIHALSPERLLTLEERRRLVAFSQRAAERLAALPMH